MRSKLLITALTFTALAVAAPAFAHEKGPKLDYPVPAATYQQHIQEKQAKIRARSEKKIAELPAVQAKEKRAKLDAKLAAMNAEVAKAVADGTVTKEEARAVRAAAGQAGHWKKHKK